MAEVRSNIDIKSNVVIATRWNIFRYRLLHEWWILKSKVYKIVWEA